MLFKSVAELLRAVARAVPLCIVLDDFHWADGQSVALLKHVARNVEQGALQLLATYRDSDLTKEHPLTGALADMRRLEGVERIALHGLEREDVQAMTEAAAGHELDADGIALAAEIASETDGNPFFVGEILRNLSESGVVAYDEASGRWLIDRQLWGRATRERAGRGRAAGRGARPQRAPDADRRGGDRPQVRSRPALKAGRG